MGYAGGGGRNKGPVHSSLLPPLATRHGAIPPAAPTQHDDDGRPGKTVLGATLTGNRPPLAAGGVVGGVRGSVRGRRGEGEGREGGWRRNGEGGGTFWPSANKRIREYATVHPCLTNRAIRCICYPFDCE